VRCGAEAAISSLDDFHCCPFCRCPGSTFGRFAAIKRKPPFGGAKPPNEASARDLNNSEIRLLRWNERFPEWARAAGSVERDFQRSAERFHSEERHRTCGRSPDPLCRLAGVAFIRPLPFADGMRRSGRLPDVILSEVDCRFATAQQVFPWPRFRVVEVPLHARPSLVSLAILWHSVFEKCQAINSWNRIPDDGVL
jgi:hypothetical protein